MGFRLYILSWLGFKEFRFIVAPQKRTHRRVYMSATLICNLGLEVCLEVCPNLLEASYQLTKNGLV